MHDNQQQHSYLHTVARLADVLESLDDLHAAASANALEMVNGRNKAELMSYLREIAYVAAETMNEIHDRPAQPTFRVIEGGKHGKTDDDDSLSANPSRTPPLRVLVATESTSRPPYVKQAGG